MQSVDPFEPTPKRRSTGESDSIARAIRNALDPELQYPQPSIDIFGPSTSNFGNYEENDESILAIVSSTHSSQELSTTTDREKPPKKVKKEKKIGEKFPIFNSKPAHQPIMDDFLSPDDIERYRNRPRKPYVKQIRMDDYLFKARRIDKGSREFGLHTTHEPKRGSKKKRDSIESLEVENIQKPSKKHNEQHQKKPEQLDFTLAFTTPSPARNRQKTSKLTKFFEKNPSKTSNRDSKIENRSNSSSIMYNDPSAYSNDSILDDTIISSTPPDKSSFLAETMPLATPSPKNLTPKRALPTSSARSIFGHVVLPNPMKRKDLGVLAAVEKDRQPLKQAKRQKTTGSSKKPEFDYPSSPITLHDEQEEQDLKLRTPERKTLQNEEAQRKQFGRHMSEREQLMKQLVDQKFREERENGDLESRRAQLKDGQVIRNKEMRKNLMHGAACKCCRAYYDGLEMDEKEKEQYINQISRHRYVHQPLPDTPERYWDLTMGPRDEDSGNHVQMTQSRRWEDIAEKMEWPTGINTWN
ncbi:DNA endonuclease activator Ctp1 C-terminal domain-containing protein [Caenorhabditis elegans]|uniref:DNA endonuclease activator Ctp1 C-terminal domain-containing protein n=1 Tax=Caenorhabditis elegans TaxID=6239 RepID=Q18606_CAEEL|nr:DNA endonuclease activator Ctp1 C-terminal domain-containing protein [Caenorhabditis elegans]CAA97782.4 DNA endonuclease activator Ctp1 C-terminal domain-containing protein [Caenorhabditis elegans]|eukprot:NP_499398.3 Completion Of Meiotic recombination (budding yeast Com) related [Caenorhabditis elegans]